MSSVQNYSVVATEKPINNNKILSAPTILSGSWYTYLANYVLSIWFSCDNAAFMWQCFLDFTVHYINCIFLYELASYVAIVCKSIEL